MWAKCSLRVNFFLARDMGFKILLMQPPKHRTDYSVLRITSFGHVHCASVYVSSINSWSFWQIFLVSPFRCSNARLRYAKDKVQLHCAFLIDSFIIRFGTWNEFENSLWPVRAISCPHVRMTISKHKTKCVNVPWQRAFAPSFYTWNILLRLPFSDIGRPLRRVDFAEVMHA